MADHLVRRSVWIIGGDGWAYDIGSSGVDHVLASGRNVNILVSTPRSTPIPAVRPRSRRRWARSPSSQMPASIGKKDLALQAISYGNVYVARSPWVPIRNRPSSRFAKRKPTGPSLILAYSHCIAHGINMQHGLDQQSRAVQSGHWPLIRFNPEVGPRVRIPSRSTRRGRPSLRDYAEQELRYRMLVRTNPKEAKMLMDMAQRAIDQKWKLYEEMAAMHQN
jgi:pyruvate-ferredoxin/flavodoxin oxidoreductase